MACKNYRLMEIVYFCFVETTCRNNVLTNLLFDIIIKLQNCGAIVHALIADISSNFIQLSRNLGISPQNFTFLINNMKG